MTLLPFMTTTMTWSVGHLGVLGLMDRGLKRRREAVFELWSAWFYATLCLWTAALVLSSRGGLFAPLGDSVYRLVSSTIGYYAAQLAATKVYLGRHLPFSFVLHHVVFMSLFAMGGLYYSQQTPMILALAYLQQSTGVTFHLMNAFTATSELSAQASALLSLVDYVLFGLARVIYFPALALAYCLHAATAGAHDLFTLGVFPLGFIVGTAFNLYWFSMKTRKQLPSVLAFRQGVVA